MTAEAVRSGDEWRLPGRGLTSSSALLRNRDDSKDPRSLTTHPEFAAEQAVIDRAYARLDDMRAQARAVAADVLEHGRGGTHSARFERDVRVEVTERRLAALREADAGLVFGRIDRRRRRAPLHRPGGDRRRGERAAGRRLAGAGGRAVLPGHARPPLGLARRRHFLLRGRRLVGIEDDLLGVEARRQTATRAGRRGRPAGRPRRARTGRMARHRRHHPAGAGRDHPAPRCPASSSSRAGRAPGKTAVALHRAAYLLYTHRFPLERAGVLLIGPNRVFLRYIEQVLPVAGRAHASRFGTPATLVPAVTVTGPTTARAARVKGDVRMAAGAGPGRAPAPAARCRRTPVPLGAHVLTLTPADTARIVSRVKRRRRDPQRAPRRFERQIEPPADRPVARPGGPAPTSHPPRPRAPAPAPSGRTGRARAHVARADARRPAPRPLRRPRPAAAGGPRRPRPRSGRCSSVPGERRLADVAWTEDDVALLDEAAVHLGPLPTRARPAAPAPTPTSERHDRAGHGRRRTDVDA